MHQIDHLLFDLDGTLTDSGEGITKAVQYALSKFDIEVQDHWELKHFVGPPLHDSFQEQFGLSAKDTEQSILHFRDYYVEKGIFENKPYPEIEKTLAHLQAQGFRLAVATAKPIKHAISVLERFALTAFFSHINGAKDGLVHQTKQDIINECVARFPVEDMNRFLMIGDRKHDILGAKQLGIRAVGVLYGYGSEAELKEAGALHVVSEHSEIIGLLETKK